MLTGLWQLGKVDKGVVVLWFAKHFLKKELSYFGFGEGSKQVRDLLHVNDFIDSLKYKYKIPKSILENLEM